MENQEVELTEDQKTALEIHQEFQAIEALGKPVLNLLELEQNAPTIYSFIFENYEEDKANGVETPAYSVIEDKENLETFKFTKK